MEMVETDNQPTKSADDEQPVPETVDAGPPFDHPAADAILRSSDNVDFRVHKLLLSLASTVFNDMFSLPQDTQDASQDEMKDGLPVIQVAEARRVLERFLFMCYPPAAVDPPEFDENFRDVEELMEVAIKYHAERIEKRLRKMLVSPKFLEADPLRVFGAACRCKMSEEAKMAARATLAKDILKREYGPEIASITGGQMFHLLQYHAECVNVARREVYEVPVKSKTFEMQEECSTPFCGAKTYRLEGDVPVVRVELPFKLAASVPGRREIEAAMEGSPSTGRPRFVCSGECGQIFETGRLKREHAQHLCNQIESAVSLVPLKLEF